MTNAKKKQSPAEVKRLKIISLCGLLAREEYGTVAFLQLKLTKEEWAGLIQNKECTEAQAQRCITELGMLAPSPAKKGRFDGQPENIKSIGEKIERALDDFMNSYSKDFKVLADAGFHLSPQWRNDAKKGIRTKEKQHSPN